MVIFGAGDNGRDFACNYSNLPILCFVDNYRKEEIEKRTGLPIYSMNEYQKRYSLEETTFVISVSNRKSVYEIVQILKEYGVEDNNIVDIVDWRNNCSQYFDLFVPNKKETFVDCGAYDGSTAFRFAGWCAGAGMPYEKIWCFEPDKDSFARCKKTLHSLKNIFLYPYGISDKQEEVYFQSNGRENARIIKNESELGMTEKITVVKLDEFLHDERITFIKMDIEGAEYDALKGAERIIKEQKPRLAISIYHNPYHIVTIPELLLRLRPDYKFYLRHYSLLANETILYAE